MKKIFLLLVVSFFCKINIQAQQCSTGSTPFTPSTNPTNPTCPGANNGSATVSTGNGVGPFQYVWTPSNLGTGPSANNLGPGTYTVTVTGAGCSQYGAELVKNGNFSSGYTQFNTNLNYQPNQGSQALYADNLFAIGTNANNYHNNFFGTDHTTGNGNFMIINGNRNPGGLIWGETVNVTPNTDYYFSVWMMNLNGISPPIVQFQINDIDQAQTFSPQGVTLWVQKCITWNSGNSTTAKIELINQSTQENGNDFGLDDFSFRTCLKAPVSVPVTIVDPTPVVVNITTVNYTSCTGVGSGTGSASANVSGGTPGYTYAWSTNPPEVTASISNLAAGTYSVLVTDANGCTQVQTSTVTVSSGEPTAAFSSVPVCPGMATTFTDGSTAIPGDPIVGWSWTFAGGNPATSTSQITASTYPTGNYTATLVVTTQAGCTDTIVQPVSINAKPKALFTSSSVCLNSPTDLTNSSTGAVSFQWDFGDPASGANNTSTLSTATLSHTFSGAGTYSVTLIASGGSGCSDTLMKVITVNPSPTAIASAPSACLTTANQFADNSTGSPTKWAWIFDDAKTSNMQNPAHTFGTAGLHTATLVITNSFGCPSVTIVQTNVNPLPTANFNSLPVCLGSQTCFTNLSTISTGTITGWSWNFGQGNLSTQPSPCYTFTTSGTHPVLLTATSDSGCQNSLTIQAIVIPPPIANFTATAVCLNATSTFTDASAAASANDPIKTWDWNFGDGQANSNQPSPTHAYATAGTHTVTLMISSVAGCKDTVDEVVTVYSPPIAAFTFPDSGCAPVCQTFVDTSKSVDGVISKWAWTLTSGTPPTASTSSVQACWNTPGSYGVQLTVTTIYGCTNTLSIPNYIKVFDDPKADFSPASDKASINEPTFLFNDMWSTDVVKWSWDFGDGSALDSINTDPTHSYTASATGNAVYKYNVCLHVVNKGGCVDDICKIVELIPEFMFYIPNTITPNGDHTNDYFFGKCRGVKEYNIWVFDRWGNLIWECNHKGDNAVWDRPTVDGLSSSCKWDGKAQAGGADMTGSSDKLVQEDVYVWKVKITDIFDKKHNYVGNVNVVRN